MDSIGDLSRGWSGLVEWADEHGLPALVDRAEVALGRFMHRALTDDLAVEVTLAVRVILRDLDRVGDLWPGELPDVRVVEMGYGRLVVLLERTPVPAWRHR